MPFFCWIVYAKFVTCTFSVCVRRYNLLSVMVIWKAGYMDKEMLKYRSQWSFTPCCTFSTVLIKRQPDLLGTRVCIMTGSNNFPMNMDADSWMSWMNKRAAGHCGIEWRSECPSFIHWFKVFIDLIPTGLYRLSFCRRRRYQDQHHHHHHHCYVLFADVVHW